jgi:hypothetical protein
MDVNSIKPIPFWENIFLGMANASSALSSNGQNCAPNASGAPLSNPTATQNVYELWNCYSHNETFELDLPASITGVSSPLPNSKYGPYTFFHDQFSSLYSWRKSALRITTRCR